MADTTGGVEEMIDPVTGETIDQKELAGRLLAQAREQGVSLVGPGGLLNQLTKNVLETALGAELTEHSGVRAWADPDRVEHAQRHQGRDGADRDASADQEGESVSELRA